jgi:hypothetical protein
MSNYVSIPEMLLLVVLLSAFGILFLVIRKVIENLDLFRGKRATAAAFLISCTAVAGTAAMLLAPNSAAESEHARNVAVNYSLLPYVAPAGAVILLELLLIAVRISPDTGGEVPSKKPEHPSVKPKAPGKPKKEKPVKGQSKEVAKAAGEMTKKGEGLS